MANIIRPVYTYRDNNLRLRLVQGEGLSGTPTSTSHYKKPRFQLFSDSGVISVVGVNSIKYHAIFEDGTKSTYDCVVEDAASGIISLPITTGMTASAGLLYGQICVNFPTNMVMVAGINFIVEESIDVDISNAVG